MHITEADITDPEQQRRAARDAIEDARRRAVMKIAPAVPAVHGRYVRIRTLGKVLKQYHATVVEPLRRKVEVLEASLQVERRIARLEQRMGAGGAPGEPADELPADFRSGSWRQ